MKKICCSRLFVGLLFFTLSLFANVNDKSAIVYYGDKISYSMVGIHDYIIVQPEKTNTKTHGFSLYKKKMYAYVSIGEIHQGTKEFADINSSWLVTKNEAWQSEVVDIKNLEYQKFLFEKIIEPRVKEGFENFFFDTLDSYHLIAKTDEERAGYKEALISFIQEFHKRYPDSKLILNRGFELIDEVHDSIEAVLFESYYMGVSGVQLAYAPVSDEAREWLDIQINKVKSYKLPIIALEYLDPKESAYAGAIIEQIKAKGMIPYIANRELTTYGLSSKNAIKREIFTLIDESEEDRITLSAHRQGALIFEYMGYIQKLHDINKGLPGIDEMRHYGGVVIWLSKDAPSPKKLITWVEELIAADIKVVFAGLFGVGKRSALLKALDINLSKEYTKKIKIVEEDPMLGFEIEPPLSASYETIESKSVKSLLVYQNSDNTFSKPAAITSWGGYAIGESLIVSINEEELWVVNPFKFFQETLRLQRLLIPDTTTENGKRLLFSHVDGDGIMNRVEGDAKKFSGEIIFEKILKRYNIPQSISLIGAEVDSKGLYPEIAPQLQAIAKEIYSLENVEGATHTFTHPFFWNKIKNNILAPEYRLKVKDYNFSLEREISQTLDEINSNYMPAGKTLANTIYWSGDCIPRKNALEYVYEHNILNINGGDTVITKTKPWIVYVSPMGIERDEYYQIFTGAQNENVYTNNWLGPFWGFKKVVQTFELTNSPRRFKPIDIYYHLYSGSKMASIKALEYVFDWAIKQDVMPIFTSEYIPKVMDYYTASMTHEGEEWLVEGMKDLKTLRIEQKDAMIDFADSNTILGVKHFENHTYISLDNESKHHISLAKNAQDTAYLISSNAKLVDFKNGAKTKVMKFAGHVDLKLNFHLTQGCKVSSIPKEKIRRQERESLFLEYENIQAAKLLVSCK